MSTTPFLVLRLSATQRTAPGSILIAYQRDSFLNPDSIIDRRRRDALVNRLLLGSTNQLQFESGTQGGKRRFLLDSFQFLFVGGCRWVQEQLTSNTDNSNSDDYSPQAPRQATSASPLCCILVHALLSFKEGTRDCAFDGLIWIAGRPK